MFLIVIKIPISKLPKYPQKRKTKNKNSLCSVIGFFILGV